MPLDGPQFGMREDGTPFPVPALVLQDQGRGALWGLVAGDALGRGPGKASKSGVAEDACAVAESLMAHGGYEPDDVAQRAGWSERPRGVASLVRAVPIALFYANDEDLRYSVTMAECDEPGDCTPLLAAAAVSGALARVVFESDTSATEMLVAAIASLDAVTLRLVDAAPATRAAVKAANDALREEIGLALESALSLDDATSAPGMTLRVAFWHLFHDTAPEDAIRDALAVPGLGSAEAAVVGALLGALAGEDALSDAVKGGASALALPGQQPAIERLLPFVHKGPLAGG